jgi:hypothetical protein
MGDTMNRRSLFASGAALSTIALTAPALAQDEPPARGRSHEWYAGNLAGLLFVADGVIQAVKVPGMTTVDRIAVFRQAGPIAKALMMDAPPPNPDGTIMFPETLYWISEPWHEPYTALLAAMVTLVEAEDVVPSTEAAENIAVAEELYREAVRLYANLTAESAPSG